MEERDKYDTAAGAYLANVFNQAFEDNILNLQVEDSDGSKESTKEEG